MNDRNWKKKIHGKLLESIVLIVAVWRERLWGVLVVFDISQCITTKTNKQPRKKLFRKYKKRENFLFLPCTTRHVVMKILLDPSLISHYFFLPFLECNRTYYGNVGTTYHMELHRPKEEKTPFVCQLTFTAAGGVHGDIVQVRDLFWEVPFSNSSLWYVYVNEFMWERMVTSSPLSSFVHVICSSMWGKFQTIFFLE